MEKYFRRKNCLLSMGENSLQWLILRGHPELLNADGQRHRGRVTRKLKEKKGIFCWDEIEYLSLEKDVSLFNKNNPNVNLNVFTALGEKVVPLYPSKNRGEIEIDLFYLEEKLYLITNFSRLICRQTGKQGLRVACKKCLKIFVDTGYHKNKSTMDCRLWLKGKMDRHRC